MPIRPSTAPLIIAGMVAPVWFIAMVIVQGILQPDYSHIAMPVSALAAWPAGWMQNANFFVTGTLMAAFTIGMNAVIQSAGPNLLVLTTEGELIVAPRSPEKFEELRRYRVAESQTWAHPVVLGSRIVIRDADSVAVWSLK